MKVTLKDKPEVVTKKNKPKGTWGITCGIMTLGTILVVCFGMNDMVLDGKYTLALEPQPITNSEHQEILEAMREEHGVTTLEDNREIKVNINETSKEDMGELLAQKDGKIEELKNEIAKLKEELVRVRRIDSNEQIANKNETTVTAPSVDERIAQLESQLQAALVREKYLQEQLNEKGK